MFPSKMSPAGPQCSKTIQNHKTKSLKVVSYKINNKMIQNLDVALNFQQRGSRWYRFANINGSVPAVLHPLILSSVVFLTHQTLLHV